MSGRVFVSALLGFSLIFGAVLWYFQTQAFYYEVELVEPAQPQTSTVAPTLGGSESSAPQTITSSDDAPSNAKPAPLGDQQVAALPAIDATPAAEIVSRPTGRVKIEMIRYTDGLPEAVLLKNFRGIDADTSPLKFKGCFTMVNSIPFLTETYEVYDDATPLRAPGWFDCFDMETITDDLEAGTAIAFLSQKNIEFGIDRVIAVNDDGNGFVWHQFNECGTASFAGEPLPEGCAPRAER